jgi:hypothetical protein
MLVRGGRLLDNVSIGNAGETLAMFHLQMNGLHAALMPAGARFDVIAYHPNRQDSPIRFQVRTKSAPNRFGGHSFSGLVAVKGFCDYLILVQLTPKPAVLVCSKNWKWTPWESGSVHESFFSEPGTPFCLKAVDASPEPGGPATPLQELETMFEPQVVEIIRKAREGRLADALPSPPPTP